jgi:hypothetical protein
MKLRDFALHCMWVFQYQCQDLFTGCSKTRGHGLNLINVQYNNAPDEFILFRFKMVAIFVLKIKILYTQREIELNSHKICNI